MASHEEEQRSERGSFGHAGRSWLSGASGLRPFLAALSRLDALASSPLSRGVARLSPSVWAVFFLLLAWRFYTPVPDHWHWDVFSYLDAAKQGTPYVRLGLGRPLFCALGLLFESIADRTSADPLWGCFRIWVVVGVGLQAAALAALGVVLAKRLGVVAAHVFLALFVTHADTVKIFLRVYPENWATLLLALAGATLGWGRGEAWRGRLVAGACLTFLMVMMKETAVCYLPALTLAAFWSAPKEMPLPRRLLLIGAWAAGAGAVPLTATRWVLPALVPGLAQAQAYLVEHHFAQASVGVTSIGPNVAAFFESYRRYHVILAFAGLGLARLGLGAAARRMTPKLAAIYALALTLLLVPLVVIAATGAHSGIARYSSALLPGICLLGAAAFAAPCRWLPRSPTAKAIVVLFLIPFMVRTCDRGPLHTIYKEARNDERRYEEMIGLRNVALAIYGGEDCMCAHFIQSHAAGGRDNKRWVIHWPDWGKPDSYRIKPGWVQSQLAAGRRIAVSKSAASQAGMPLDRLLLTFAPLEFDEHPCGWWISRRP